MKDDAVDRDVALARQFVVLADTLVADYDVVDLLDRLVHAIVELLPVDHAGLLLLDETQQPQVLAATSESSRLLELFQLQSTEGGPCLECLTTGARVSVDDLAAEQQRWPRFSREAVDRGYRAVHALPLRLRGETIGALNLFGRSGPISGSDLEVGQSLADMATLGILQQRSSRKASVEAEQLRRALGSRVVIEQAKGLLAEAGGLDMGAAFHSLRSYSRSNNRRIGEVAQALVRRDLPARLVLPAGGSRS